LFYCSTLADYLGKFKWDTKKTSATFSIDKCVNILASWLHLGANPNPLHKIFTLK
jgi:hypothetical protein